MIKKLIYIFITLALLVQPTIPQYPATDAMQHTFDLVIANSAIQVPIKPTLIVGSDGDPHFEAYSNWDTHEIHLGEQSDVKKAFDRGNPEGSRKLWDMWAIQVLAHEYGHQIQGFVGKGVYNEAEASTFATKCMLNMGYTVHEMEEYYRISSTMVGGPEPQIGHPDPQQEVLDNMNNVAIVDALIKEALTK